MTEQKCNNIFGSFRVFFPYLPILFIAYSAYSPAGLQIGKSTCSSLRQLPEDQSHLEKEGQDMLGDDVRECRCNACLDVFVAYNEHALLVTRHKHDALFRPRIQLNSIKKVSPVK